jgi:hypothetical protein
MNMTVSDPPSPAERLPVGTVTFPFTDIEGSATRRPRMEQFRNALRTRGIISPENVIVGVMQCADVGGKPVRGEAL